MEENTDGKRKTNPSIPANYISILQLQERWNIEKDRKQKEEERRRKQQVEEQQNIEEDLKKPEVRRIRRNRGSNSKKKVSIDGREERFAEPSAIRSERGEDSTPRDEGLPKKKKKKKNKGSYRKRYDSRKKTNQDVAVKEDIVEYGGSLAPPENIVTENNTPVTDVIRVYRDKGEEAKGNGPREIAVTAIETQFEDLSVKRDEIKARIRSSNQRHKVKDVIRIYREKGEKAKGNGSREKAVATDHDATAMETQFEDLSIKRGGETQNLKAQTRLSNRNRPNRVRKPIGDATMVWVKKGNSERDGIGSGVKPLNAVTFD